MAHPITIVQFEYFKRHAKQLAREHAIPYSKALDQVAQAQGYANWSLLAKHSDKAPARPLGVIPSAHQASFADRYYLHGDQREVDASQYYCARCDLFSPPEHFSDADAHTLEHHGERFLREHDRWQEWAPERPQWRRPLQAVNLLAKDAFRARRAYERSRSSFHRWLLAQADCRDPVGQLAQDVRGDAAFPVSAGTLRALKAYLVTRGDHVVEALKEAWQEFSAHH